MIRIINTRALSVKRIMEAGIQDEAEAMVVAMLNARDVIPAGELPVSQGRDEFNMPVMLDRHGNETGVPDPDSWADINPFSSCKVEEFFMDSMTQERRNNPLIGMNWQARLSGMDGMSVAASNPRQLTLKGKLHPLAHHDYQLEGDTFKSLFSLLVAGAIKDRKIRKRAGMTSSLPSLLAIWQEAQKQDKLQPVDPVRVMRWAARAMLKADRKLAGQLIGYWESGTRIQCTLPEMPWAFRRLGQVVEQAWPKVLWETMHKMMN